MLDPQHPRFSRIFVSASVDHLAPAEEILNPEPICGQRTLNSWGEYGDELAPSPGVRLCSRCEALADN